MGRAVSACKYTPRTAALIPAITLTAWLGDAQHALARVHVFSPAEARIEAHALASYALGQPRVWLVAHGDETLCAEWQQRLDAALARRLAGEPIAQIVGVREFYGRDFKVTAAVLIPRPETEHLLEAALTQWPAGARVALLDVGTGSGCVAISLALERPEAEVTALDISPDALAVAQENARALGAALRFVEGDLFAPLGGQRFAGIVSNPPYIAAADPHLAQGDLRFEPALALASGVEGLDTIRRLIAAAPDHLVSGGWLMLEHGYNQGTAVRALLTQRGFVQVETQHDLAGLDRLSLGRWA
ncbi:MAG: peptide chain release factor N(5)-glutamine methyltransferase [Betaproteobacteria bacterium]|nr:MAG: peptide chain release factor N(5)-glutamine methyltransferase [Betaproteobacteria bacterium]